ncbi:aminotransferase [Paraoerskovia sediminicola]|uniref:Aminotransferase n=1 Tax=Paraoerskovia sediminicola TaxID=1138587 RepID=A0ABM8G582_9CELL|nr:aminotransferase class V-fold PLP-dependent enzyme [Paraoerskovia sediminicola]BDZ43317.1 aminotransferase [Paraoerskovia sediminicola]
MSTPSTLSAPSTAGRRVPLDNGGGAPLHPLARTALLQATDDGWADPRRLHAEGRRAAALLWGARESLAASLGARTEEIEILPSHTAALHAAVLAVRAGRRRAGRAVVVPAVERAAVHHAAVHPLPDLPGEARPVAVDRHGRVDIDGFRDAVGAGDVALACLQSANGEVGTRQPVTEAAEACAAAQVPLLVDAGSSLGHDPVPTGWDVLAADPADWGAPRGTGVLAVRRRVRTRPTWPEDEDRWAPGGPNVPAALAAAVALEAVARDREAEARRRSELVDRVRAAAAQIPDTEVVGDPVDRLPHAVTFSFLYVDGEALVGELDRAGFGVGSGSACTSGTLEPSHVLAAMGVLTHGNVRIALDRTTTEDDVDRFVAVLPGAVERVRAFLGARGL